MDTIRIRGARTHNLRSIDLDIAPGTFLAIVGPSGSGKSTLLHVLGTLDKPTSGIVKVAGFDISKLSDKDLSGLRSQHVGFIFQQFHLVPYLNVLENVLAPGLAARREGAVQRAQELIAQGMDSIEEVAEFVTEQPGVTDPQRGYRVAAMLLSLGAVHWV